MADQKQPKPQATDPEAEKIRKELDAAYDRVRAKHPDRPFTMDVNIPPLPSVPTSWTRGQTRPLAVNK